MQMLRRLRLLLHRKRDSELREEMAFHREMLAADRGLSPASPEAERAFGNELLLRERARDVLGWTWVDDLWCDLRLVVRQLRKRPFVVSIAILSLALGVASCATFFGLVDLLSLQPLAVPNPGQLVSVAAVGKGAAVGLESRLPLLIAESLAGKTDLFASAYAWDDDELRTMSVGKSHFLGTVNEVSGGAFATLSEYPILGRPIENRDVDLATGQSARVAVISYVCWRARFGGTPSVIGKTLTVDGNPLTIIGVTGPEFSDIDRDSTPDAIVPIGFGHPKNVRSYSMQFTARLRPGVTMARAKAVISAAAPALLADFKHSEPDFRLPNGTSPRELILGPEWRGTSIYRELYGRSALLLFGLAGLVFLVACLNLSTLVVARANARAPEFRVRLALGATRWRILRLVLLDVLLISSAGAVLGVFIADWAMKLLIRSFWMGWVPAGTHLRPNAGALAVAGLTALLIATVIGIIPALRVARFAPSQSGLRVSLTGMTRRIAGSTWLAAFEAAFALVLVMLALILGTNVYRSGNANLGYDQSHILTLNLFQQRSPAARPPDGQIYYEKLTSRLRSLPGVESVSYAFGIPVQPHLFPTPVSTAKVSYHAEYATVAPGFFHLLKIPIVAGRDFSWNNNRKSTRVAILSEALAVKLFPGQNPLGQQVRLTEPLGPSKTVTIVGIARGAALWKPDNRQPEAVFTPFAEECSNLPCDPTVLIRTRGNPMALARASEAAVRSVGYQYSIRTQSLQQKFEKSLTGQRFASWLATDFALIALGLASLGLYALLSFRVAERNKEIAIRMALGARGYQILRLVLHEAFLVVAAGLLIAIPLLVLAFRVLAANGAALPPHMPAEGVGAVAILIAAALLAVYAPASKAYRTNPADSLRDE